MSARIQPLEGPFNEGVEAGFNAQQVSDTVCEDSDLSLWNPEQQFISLNN